MQYKKYTKQRIRDIQGLRSLKDTLPKNIKKVISKRGHIYSETLNNWKYIAGAGLFKVCYPKSYKDTNKFGESTLLIMVKRGHEVELEYSKNEIMDRMNKFFDNSVVKKIKITSFENELLDKNNNELLDKNNNESKLSVTNNKFKNKINNIKKEKIKKSLIELTKVFRKK